MKSESEAKTTPEETVAKEFEFIDANKKTELCVLTLPETIFTVAPIMTMAQETLKDFWCGAAPYWGLMYLTVVVQFVFIWYLNDASKAGDFNCGATDRLLQNIALSVFTVAAFGDARESIMMMWYFWKMPRAQKDPKTNKTRWRANVFTANKVTGEITGFKEGHGITDWFFAVICSTVVIPKLIVFFVLWEGGIRFLVGSEQNQDLILNATALIFVLEIDDQIYTSICPDDVKQQLDMWPEITSKKRVRKNQKSTDTKYNRRCDLLEKFVIPILAMFCIGLSLLYRDYLCAHGAPVREKAQHGDDYRSPHDTKICQGFSKVNSYDCDLPCI